MHFFTGKYIAEHPVNCHRSCEGDKRIENNIHIIIAKTENIYKGKEFDEHIALQIIPPRRIRRKKSSIFIFITAMKNIEKKF